MSHRNLLPTALALLTVSPASAEPGPDSRDCFIRRAEATICPVYEVTSLQQDGFRLEGLSGDGATIVGALATDSGGTVPARFRDRRWRALEGFSNLEFGSASVASRDGSVVAGSVFFGAPGYGSATYRWQQSVVEIINSGPAFPWAATAMSADGGTVVVFDELDGGRWREGEGPAEFLRIPGSPTFLADVSADGEVFVGRSFFFYEALRWEGNVVTALPLPGGGTEPAGASGISPDGRVIVGGTNEAAGPGALWRDGVFESREFPLVDASWDGVFLTGRPSQGFGPAYFWDASGSVEELGGLLTALGLEVSDPPARAKAMSDDGHVLIGQTFGVEDFRAVVAPKLGIDVQPYRRRNRIDLASERPVAVRVYGSAQADASQVDPEDLRFGPERAAPVGARRLRDHNRDGHLDRDFLFDAAEAGLAVGDREACLAGVAANLPFRLCSRARVTLEGCGRGGELALLLPLAIALRRARRRA